MVPGFVETMQKSIEIHKTKNDDYSGANGPFFNFDVCEYISGLFKSSKDKVYAVFIAVKLARLSVVLTSDKVNNESIEDSFDDLITYAGIWKSDVMSRTKAEVSNRAKRKR